MESGQQAQLVVVGGGAGWCRAAPGASRCGKAVTQRAWDAADDAVESKEAKIVCMTPALYVARLRVSQVATTDRRAPLRRPLGI